MFEQEIVRPQIGEAAALAQARVEGRTKPDDRIRPAAAVERREFPGIALKIRARLNLVGKALGTVRLADDKARLAQQARHRAESVCSSS